MVDIKEALLVVRGLLKFIFASRKLFLGMPEFEFDNRGLELEPSTGHYHQRDRHDTDSNHALDGIAAALFVERLGFSQQIDAYRHRIKKPLRPNRQLPPVAAPHVRSRRLVVVAGPSPESSRG